MGSLVLVLWFAERGSASVYVASRLLDIAVAVIELSAVVEHPSVRPYLERALCSEMVSRRGRPRNGRRVLPLVHLYYCH